MSSSDFDHSQASLAVLSWDQSWEYSQFLDYVEICLSIMIQMGLYAFEGILLQMVPGISNKDPRKQA